MLLALFYGGVLPPSAVLPLVALTVDPVCMTAGMIRPSLARVIEDIQNLKKMQFQWIKMVLKERIDIKF